MTDVNKLNVIVGVQRRAIGGLKKQLAAKEEEIRKLREEQGDAEWKATWYAAHLEDMRRSAHFWQNHFNQVKKENVKLRELVEDAEVLIQKGRTYAQQLEAAQQEIKRLKYRLETIPELNGVER